MILVRLMGGLGNQMFQYAFAQNLSIQKRTDLKIDLSLLGEPDLKKEYMVIRHFDLDVFKINFVFASSDEIELYNGKRNPSFVDRIKFKLNRILGKHTLVFQSENDFNDKQLATISDDCCIVGRWQSEHYFKENSSQIKQLFDLNHFTPNTYSAGVLKTIKKGISVGIHVRRGDYVTNPIYSKGIGALSIQYYYDALEIVKNRLSEINNGITYFFISDDIDWCKRTFSNLLNCVFVEQEKSKNGYISDLMLLTQCNHVIISNSTFAWWGAYLGEKEDSIIIAPEIWAKEKKFIPDHIVPERWVKVKNTFETK